MKVRIKLKRSWSVTASREREYYYIYDDYEKVCENENSDGWQVIYYDHINVTQGALIDVVQIDVLGQQRVTQYQATSEGLVFVD